MKTCPHCKNQLKDTAKFCGKCGSKVPDAAEATSANDAGVTCPKCGNVLKASAKFCGKCGTRLEAAPTMPTSAAPAEGKTLERVGNSGYVRWTMLPGQVAVKITEEEIEACGKVKGIAIQDGTKALFFVNGKLVAELGPGSYKFAKLRDPSTPAVPSDPDEERRAGGFWAGLRRTCANAARAVANLFRSVSEATSAKRKVAISVVIVRSVEFPLVFSIKDANTANLRTEVGLHMLCKVTNINDFYQNLLLDRKFVSFEEMQRALSLLVLTEVNHAVAAVSPEQVANNMPLVQDLEARLRPVVVGVYPFVALVRVIQLTAEHEALESLRRMSEELYVSEQELAQLQKRNDFLNRLQSVKNEQELMEGDLSNAQELSRLRQTNAHEAAMAREDKDHELVMKRREAEFEAGKLKIYEDMELTADERARFDVMLAAQRQIREAKSDEEVAVALHEFEKSGLFRAEEIDNIKRQIAQDAKIRDLDDAQALAVLTMQNEQSLAKQKLDWEIQIGNRKLDDELARGRKIDDYNDERRDKNAAFSDERREKDAAFQDARRQADLDFEKQERDRQFESLRQAQTLRMEREEAEHRREMESDEAEHRHTLEAVNAAREHEETMQKQKLEAEMESQRIYAGMSYEQIVAANPNLTPAAAQALAKKFEAEAVAAQNDKTNELLRQQNAQTAELMRQQVEMANQNKGDMMAFMQQMMQQQNSVNLKQMEMMRDTSAAFAGVRMQQQQAQQQLHDQQIEMTHRNQDIARQNAELDRTRRESDRAQDRMLAGVQSAVSAAGTAFSGRAHGGQQLQRRKESSATSASQSSASPSAGGAPAKCPKCGAALEPDSSFCGECGAAL